MTVHELNNEQMTELKQRYLMILADEGTFAEVMGVDYDEPSWGDLANAGELVPDDVVFRQWEDTEFVDEDFSETGPLPGIDFEESDRREMPWDYGKHFD